MEEYLMQAEDVLNYYDSIKGSQGAAKRVNFNFMARGEALANQVILENAKELFFNLESLAVKRGLNARFNISTIMPMEVKSMDLADVFKDVTQDYGIYYSLYSVNEKFRKHWLPKALNYEVALKKLEDLQSKRGTEIAFHWAFIEGENDSKEDLAELKNVLSNYNIKAKYNLVRYNPYSSNQGKEPTEDVLQYNFNELNEFFKSPASRIVPRVGFDVKASCGMFVINNDN
jgi:adenine C2-methylase RlmN of 23S rRNA A2503 and tRNA A37